MNKKAQGVTEYALIIATVAAALISMQVYFKRGVQSVAKTSIDQLAGFRSDSVSGVTPEQAQKMAINQELDPKYGALKFYEIKTRTDQSVTVTTPKDGEGARKTTINEWKDTVEDADPSKGKEFYQELPN